MKSVRDPSLDVFKGLCISLIMLIHIAGRALPSGFSSWANSFKLIGFFIVSGYLLSLKNSYVTIDAVVAKLRRCCVTILLPYAFFSLLALLVMPLYRATNLISATAYFNAIAGKTVSFCGYSTLWFLPVLFIAEVVLLLILVVERYLTERFRLIKFRWPLFLIIGVALSLSIVLSPLAHSYIAMPPNKRLVGDLILPWLKVLPAFVALAIGYLLYMPLLRCCRSNCLVQLSLGALLLLVGWGTSLGLGPVDWNNNVYGGNLLLFLLSGTFSSFGFLLVFRAVPMCAWGRGLAFLGVNSLVLMATHLPLPLIDLSRRTVMWMMECIGLAPMFATMHQTVFGLLVFVVLLVIEIPVILVFNHSPLRFFIGRKKN